MANDQTAAYILDETVRAIATLDLNRLKTLEAKISALAQYSIAYTNGGLSTILIKKHLLELILQNCESNLDSINRLHGRNMRDQWVH